MNEDYIVEEVDPEEWEYEILLLQSTILPDDSVMPIDGGYWWLLFHKKDRNNPIAFAALHHDKHFWYLSRSGVLPEHTGHGLQKILIKARLDKLKELKVKRVVTYTYPNNPASSNNLISCGFKLYRPEEMNEGVDTLYWYKDLS